jgi:hypothetical protein
MPAGEGGGAGRMTVTLLCFVVVVIVGAHACRVDDGVLVPVVHKRHFDASALRVRCVAW